MSRPPLRRQPVGAEVLPDRGVHFRVWAPRRRTVEVVLEGDGRPVALEAEGDGYFSGRVAAARAGSRYRFRLDGEGTPFPDPASRFQPDGVHGPSLVVDPGRFAWTDQGWRGVAPDDRVLYELHVGTFTAEGTWAAAARELPALAELGVTLVEVMPVAEFPGRFGWGYDGVSLFAPTRLYGSPNDFRAFVDRAHALGMGVLLDVVYNHFGPDGNYLGQYSRLYVSDGRHTEWGEGVNFDGDGSGPVREFFLANAGYWVEEFHLDGLRLDATHRIHDRSADHILAAIGRRVREAAGGRITFVAAEDDTQEARLVRPPERGGCDLDAAWNDDFHHAARVVLTGHHEGYLHRYRGTPQELLSAAKWGFLFQGQHMRRGVERRGTPALDLPPAAFVTYLENHDQVAASAHGRRLHALSDPGRYRAVTALWLLTAGTPMFFQGQEFAATSRFLFFADHNAELAPLVRRGRAEFMAGFASAATPETQAALHDPSDPEAFRRSKLDLSERGRHPEALALHRDLLRLRRETPVFRRRLPRSLDGAVLGPEAFVLRFFAEEGEERLLLVNLGLDLRLESAPEPLLAAPEGTRWRTLWSSEDPRYGGSGTPPVTDDAGWRLPGRAAVVLGPEAS